MICAWRERLGTWLSQGSHSITTTCTALYKRIIIFTAYLRFSQNEYVFAEEDGNGSVMIEGTPGFTANVFGRKWNSGFYIILHEPYERLVPVFYVHI